jgi:hypothetical protein
MGVQAVNAGVPNIHYLQLDTSNYDNFYDWCDGHPSAVADLAIAQQLATFIQAVMPSWSNTSAISSTADQANFNLSLFLFGSYQPVAHGS